MLIGELKDGETGANYFGISNEVPDARGAQPIDHCELKRLGRVTKVRGCEFGKGGRLIEYHRRLLWFDRGRCLNSRHFCRRSDWLDYAARRQRRLERKGVGEGGKASTCVPEHNVVVRGEAAAVDLLLQRVERLAGVGRIPNQSRELGRLHLHV